MYHNCTYILLLIIIFNIVYFGDIAQMQILGKKTCRSLICPSTMWVPSPIQLMSSRVEYIYLLNLLASSYIDFGFILFLMSMGSAVLLLFLMSKMNIFSPLAIYQLIALIASENELVQLDFFTMFHFHFIEICSVLFSLIVLCLILSDYTNFLQQKYIDFSLFPMHLL